MPTLTDVTAVRRILNHDRVWAAYAIGDLSPGFIEHCEWHAPADPAQALLLLYGGFAPPIAFAMGEASTLAPLFEELDASEISLHIRPEALDALASAYRPIETRRIHRMSLRPGAFRAVPHNHVQEIAECDAASVAALYDDGFRRGEGPTFFHASMLRQGTFRGVWQEGTLVAIAGTHLYAPQEGICAVGNVYTRSDCRGRGLAAQVTSAVVAHAIQQGVPTIVLNVGRDNLKAQRVYERLGFELYCEFLEGSARRR